MSENVIDLKKGGLNDATFVANTGTEAKTRAEWHTDAVETVPMLMASTAHFGCG